MSDIPRNRASIKTLLAGLVLALVFGVASAYSAVRLRAQDPPVDVVLGGPGGANSLAPQLQGPVSGGERFPLPAAALPAFPGRPRVELAAYRGRPLVVNFWATWCGPCVEETPDLVRTAREAGGQVSFLGVDVRDDAAAAASFAQGNGVAYDLALDPQGDFFGAVRGIGMPTTLLVDAQGTVVYRHTGALDAAQLRDLLATHLGVTLR